ncbi:peptide chain release factor N(5)-glutamine methyltransferase [bacterium]|nr:MULTISPECIES: peptide chain release factor N(5)-glutamine methyltransferase [Pirellulaceae]MDB4338602.1 peptide chain release factor N(5)-glutamine methyltransferase [Rubripirellula sp.]MDC0278983.1 peptide chain release factor N(5)-glutamine methyltransferase [bacterium]
MNQDPDKQAKDRSQTWTILRLLEWTTDFFRSRGSESPRLDAEILLAHARSCSRVELYTAFASEPSEEERVAFREMVRRRGDGMPVAQIVGYREFYSLSFRVNEATLIPRPETEHLVIEALDCAARLNRQQNVLHVADVGTGSGAIAVTLAKHIPDAQVVAVDISQKAIEIAQWNAKQHEVDGRVQFLESDLLSEVEEPTQFAMICSNPPYVTEAEYDELAPSVRDFEPRSALVSGPCGTEVIERLFEQCRERLCSGGQLIIELSPMISQACMDLGKETGLFDEMRSIKDLSGHRRLLSMRRESDAP